MEQTGVNIFLFRNETTLEKCLISFHSTLTRYCKPMSRLDQVITRLSLDPKIFLVTLTRIACDSDSGTSLHYAYKLCGVECVFS